MNGKTPLFAAASMNNKNAVGILLANMSNAFAMDNERSKIEDTTTDLTILKMIQKGKLVSIAILVIEVV